MNYRIEITTLPTMRDSRAAGVRSAIAEQFGVKLENLLTRDVYTVASPAISSDEAFAIAGRISDPVLHCFRVNERKSDNFAALPPLQRPDRRGFPSRRHRQRGPHPCRSFF